MIFWIEVLVGLLQSTCYRIRSFTCADFGLRFFVLIGRGLRVFAEWRRLLYVALGLA
jgi:hypothetical protein